MRGVRYFADSHKLQCRCQKHILVDKTYLLTAVIPERLYCRGQCGCELFSTSIPTGCSTGEHTGARLQYDMHKFRNVAIPMTKYRLLDDDHPGKYEIEEPEQQSEISIGDHTPGETHSTYSNGYTARRILCCSILVPSRKFTAAKGRRT